MDTIFLAIIKAYLNLISLYLSPEAVEDILHSFALSVAEQAFCRPDLTTLTPLPDFGHGLKWILMADNITTNTFSTVIKPKKDFIPPFLGVNESWQKLINSKDTPAFISQGRDGFVLDKSFGRVKKYFSHSASIIHTPHNISELTGELDSIQRSLSEFICFLNIHAKDLLADKPFQLSIDIDLKDMLCRNLSMTLPRFNGMTLSAAEKDPLTVSRLYYFLCLMHSISNDLQKLHNLGFAHLDIAPRNIVGADTEWHLIDFGNIKVLTPTEQIKDVTTLKEMLLQMLHFYVFNKGDAEDFLFSTYYANLLIYMTPEEASTLVEGLNPTNLSYTLDQMITYSNHLCNAYKFKWKIGDTTESIAASSWEGRSRAYAGDWSSDEAWGD